MKESDLGYVSAYVDYDNNGMFSTVAMLAFNNGRREERVGTGKTKEDSVKNLCNSLEKDGLSGILEVKGHTKAARAKLGI